MTPTAVRVVVVDDFAPMRRLVGELLQQSGCVMVGEAADGRAALEVIDGSPCDVVVMDYRMPVMDGLEATRAVRARWPRLPVVAFTSDDDPAVAALLREAGSAGHFIKDDVEGLVAFVCSRGWAGGDANR